MKLRAGALLYVTGVALIVGFITAGVVLWGYGQSLAFDQLIIRDKLIRNAHSGMTLMLAEDEDRSMVGETVDLFGEGTDIVELTQIPWGLFALNVSVARDKSSSFAVTAITGVRYSEELPALYLPDKGKPLSLSGQAYLEGNIYISDAGFKRAYVESGRSGSGKLLDGERYDSEKWLLHGSPWLENCSGAFFPTIDPTIYIEGGELSDTIQGNVTKGLMMLVPSGPIDIKEGALIRGPVIIKSNFGVEVTGGAKLENVFIHAPGVIFKSGYKGATQVLSSDSIILEADTELMYPSSIIITENSGHGYVKFKDGSSLSGGIAVLTDDRSMAHLFIEKGASVEGLVYARGKVALQGKVRGSLICEEFYLRTPSAVYENLILDGQVSGRDISEHFVYPDVVGNRSKGAVIKWIRE